MDSQLAIRLGAGQHALVDPCKPFYEYGPGLRIGAGNHVVAPCRTETPQANTYYLAQRISPGHHVLTCKPCDPPTTNCSVVFVVQSTCSGRGIAGAQVSVVVDAPDPEPDQNLSGQTDEFGQIKFGNLIPGSTLHVTYSAPRHQSISTTYVLTPCEGIRYFTAFLQPDEDHVCLVCCSIVAPKTLYFSTSNGQNVVLHHRGASGLTQIWSGCTDFTYEEVFFRYRTKLYDDVIDPSTIFLDGSRLKVVWPDDHPREYESCSGDLPEARYLFVPPNAPPVMTIEKVPRIVRLYASETTLSLERVTQTGKIIVSLFSNPLSGCYVTFHFVTRRELMENKYFVPWRLRTPPQGYASYHMTGYRGVWHADGIALFNYYAPPNTGLFGFWTQNSGDLPGFFFDFPTYVFSAFHQNYTLTHNRPGGWTLVYHPPENFPDVGQCLVAAYCTPSMYSNVPFLYAPDLPEAFSDEEMCSLLYLSSFRPRGFLFGISHPSVFCNDEHVYLSGRFPSDRGCCDKRGYPAPPPWCEDFTWTITE